MIGWVTCLLTATVSRKITARPSRSAKCNSTSLMASIGITLPWASCSLETGCSDSTPSPAIDAGKILASAPLSNKMLYMFESSGIVSKLHVLNHPNKSEAPHQCKTSWLVLNLPVWKGLSPGCANQKLLHHVLKHLKLDETQCHTHEFLQL